MTIITKFIPVFFFTLLLSSLNAQTCAPGSTGYHRIDFEVDGQGNTLQKGDVIQSDTYLNLGVSLTSNTTATTNSTGNYPLIIFDSSDPTGDDCDLGTPGYNCPNNTVDTADDCTGTFPGKSSGNEGGFNNCTIERNIMIIAENYPYATIGLADPEPDDLANGGNIILDFTEASTVIDISFVDDAEGNFIFTYDDGSTYTQAFIVEDDNDVLTFYLNESNVDKLEIQLIGSGAISSFAFCAPEQTTTTAPVEFLFFEVEEARKGARLSWATASEESSDRFEIEKSLDAISFSTIGNIAAAGFSKERVDYEFTDLGASSKLYYRIKQIDINGDFTYTDTKSVNIQDTEKVQVYPNPARHRLNIEMSKDQNFNEAKLYLAATGQLISRMAVKEGLNSVPLDSAPRGIYILELVNSDSGAREIHKISVVD